MRCVIPKSIKTETYIYKKLTIVDMLILAGLLGVTYLIYLSNIPNKLIFMIVVPVLSGAVLLFKPNDIRLISFFGYGVKFALSQKVYSKENGLLNNLVPEMSFTEVPGFINYSNSYYGCLIQVDSIEFALKTMSQQDSLIIDFGSVFNAIEPDEKLQLIKVDQPINYDNYQAYLFQKLQVEQNREVQDKNCIGLLKTRIEQVDKFNNNPDLFHEYFYFAVYGRNLEKLVITVNRVKNVLASLELMPIILDDKQFCVVNRYLYSRDFDERQFKTWTKEECLQHITPEKIVFNGKGFTINDKIQGKTYAINDYPIFVENAWGADLFGIRNTKVVVNLVPIDNSRAIKMIDRAFLEFRERGDNLHRPGDIMDNDMAIDSLEHLLLNLKRDNEMLFNTSISITAYNYDADPQYQAQVTKELTNLSLSYFNGYNRQLPFFLNSSLNMRPVDKIFSRAINTYSLACAFPFVMTQVNDQKGMMIGWNQYPVILDIRKWKYDDTGKYVNANAFTLGKSGKGKSFFTKMLLELLISDRNRIYILDPENEYYELVHNFGGKYIDVGESTSGRFNPFQFYQNMTDDDLPAPLGTEFSKHLKLLMVFFKILMPEIESNALTELDNLIKLAYAKKGITALTKIDDLKPKDYPIFDDLWAVLQSETTKYAQGTIKRENLDILSLYLPRFVNGGAYANLWNGASTIETNENMIVFNFQSLTSNDKVTANAQMLLVMRYLEQQAINIRQFNRSKPLEEQVNTFIAIDEGYIFVNEDFPIALDFIFQWYKRARKYNVSMYFATQNLGDIMRNQSIVSKTSAIVANSQYHFIFGLAELEMQVIDEVYAGRINETEKNCIIRARKGECFLISSEQDRTFFQVTAHPVVRDYFEKKISTDMETYLTEMVDKENLFMLPQDDEENYQESERDPEFAGLDGLYGG